jgi:long-chain acyl-CoA synthetase
LRRTANYWTPPRFLLYNSARRRQPALRQGDSFIVRCQNLCELLRRQAERLGPRPALRFRRYGVYHDIRWDEYYASAQACAAALADAGIQPGDRVGVLSENRVEWLLADMGLLGAAAVNVPPHAPLSARQIQFQLADADVRWLFVSTLEQLEKVQSVRQELPALDGVVVFEAPQARLPAAVSWERFLQRGRRALPRIAEELRRREAALGPADLCTIMYTSGTTGHPKGVMLTHDNLLSNAFASLEVASHEPGDIVLNWLPFSHIYARSVDHYQSLAGGFLLCLANSVDTVVSDLEEIQLTHLACVPRFYEKLLTAVATSDLEETGRRLRQVFGPRMQWLSSGGAPLPLPIAETYLAAGLPLYQGYGLTESSPVISFNRKGRNKAGTVGLALPGVQVAIASDGEVITRGPHVMMGYWKNPEATAEVIRDDWLYTGDLGELDREGYLTITGRKKELLVLSSGKKVVPSYIEGLLLGDDAIDQAVICGEGRNFLTALIVPHWENVARALGAEFNREPADRPELRMFLQCKIDTALRDLASWEQIRKFLILPRPFTVDADELTVSLKLRRGVILAKYAERLARLYENETSTPDEQCA